MDTVVIPILYLTKLKPKVKLPVKDAQPVNGRAWNVTLSFQPGLQLRKHLIHEAAGIKPRQDDFVLSKLQKEPEA